MVVCNNSGALWRRLGPHAVMCIFGRQELPGLLSSAPTTSRASGCSLACPCIFTICCDGFARHRTGGLVPCVQRHPSSPARTLRSRFLLAMSALPALVVKSAERASCVWRGKTVVAAAVQPGAIGASCGTGIARKSISFRLGRTGMTFPRNRGLIRLYLHFG